MFPDSQDHPRHTDEECARLLDRFLLSAPELLAALAPAGWNESPLMRCYHPTPEQRRREAAQLEENLRYWQRGAAERGNVVDEPGDEPDAAPNQEVEKDTRPVEPESEVVDLVGRVLWDVFSDNHSVFDMRGEFDLGSFRGAAGFLAEEINVRYRGVGDRRCYMDFYIGTVWVNRRADLSPVYRWVFAGLHAAGCDWRYSFPRMYVVSFDHEPEPADGLSSDPSAAVAAEFEAAHRERARSETQQQLDAGYNESVEQTRRGRPPTIVQSYYDVYGSWPQGWPPSRTDET